MVEFFLASYLLLKKKQREAWARSLLLLWYPRPDSNRHARKGGGF
ncbi:hypothetical protein RSK20926_19022 [Roseobacter sp. SK209-2-6]|nr:hypothetical protein RSK20926_19022 [Roseobacter sp. SK209-2-6]